jgi:four helix bundle suffix protein
LRQHGLKLWGKDDPRARVVRDLAYKTGKTYETYKSYLSDPERAANMMICLIHQTNYLLDRQINALEEKFVNEGGYTENLFKKRINKRFE